MNNQTAQLLEQHFDTAFAAPGGIKKLRELILTLAMQGMLVAQDPNDPPARELLKEIEAEKRRLVKEGKIKAPKPLPDIKAEEVPYELPQGWVWVRLGQVVEVLDSLRKPVTKHDREPGPYPYYGASGIVDCVSNYIFDEPLVLVGEDGAKWGRGENTSFTISGKTWVNNHAHVLRPYRSVLLDQFVVYSIVDMDLQQFITGMTVPKLNQARLVSIVVPLPPLPEQHRIVAKIDQLMARCDELEKLRAEREKKQLAIHTAALRQLLDCKGERFFAPPGPTASTFLTRYFGELYAVKENVAELRKAILQLAVMGKLVPQDPTDPPASELLKEIEVEKRRLVKEGKIKQAKPLAEIKPEEVPYAVPEGWTWVRVWDVAQLITSGSRDWAKYYSDNGSIFVTMGNLSRGSYELRMDSIRYVDPPENGEGSRTKLEKDDLLISITGDVGNLGLIPSNFGDAYINQHTCLLRFMPSCRSRYFPELMRSPLAKLQFDAPQRGVKNSFRLGDVGEMVIPLPPLPEQNRIVAKIDQLMALCDTLDQQIDAATGKQTELLTSVMARVA